MKEYFLLQLKLMSRKIRALGVNPVAGFILLIAGFVGGSVLLFERIYYSQYIFIVVAALIILPLSETRRNDFLKFHFTTAYLKVRVIENFIRVMPFAAFLFIRSSVVEGIIILMMAVLLVFIKTGGGFNFVIPTPFSKTPFEFTTGFRKGIVYVCIAYLLAIIGLLVPNFNIGVFSLILLFIISLSFYTEPEDEYYVWIFNRTPKQFLLMKIKTAVINATLLTTPAIVLLAIFFFDNIYVLPALLLLGNIVVATVIVAKYSAWPQKMNIPQVILLVLSIQLPPLLLAAFPYFYFQSVKRLKPLLQ